MNAQSNVAHLLAKLDATGRLTTAAYKAIAALPMKIRHAAKGEVLAREGESPHHSMLIVRGATCMYKHAGDGQRQILVFHFPGDIPDLQSLHLEQLDMSLMALTPSIIGCVAHEDIRALCHRHPAAADALWRASLLDAALLRESMLNIGQRAAATRTAHFLCELAVRMTLGGQGEKRVFPMPVTQVQMADGLGLSPVHVNRIVQRLRARRLVDITRSQMRVRDWAGLRKAGDFDPAYLHLTPRQLSFLAEHL